MAAADAERCDTEYLVLTEPFRSEVCNGFDHRAVARLLLELGALRPEGNGRLDSKVRIGSLGTMRAYRIQSSIFSLDIG